MTPDSYWPNIKNPFAPTEEEHAAHRTPRGIATPADLTGDMKMTKMAKLAMKFIHKKHLSVKGTMTNKVSKTRSRKKTT